MAGIEKTGNEKVVETAVRAARCAGAAIVARYPPRQKPSVKGYRDLVTDADTAAEAVIMKMIQTDFPGHGILSEEAGDNETRSDWQWVVDPLDGTRNYAHSHPLFSVSIGVLERGEPMVGVVYDPLRDHMFVAERGGGVELNGKPIYVSAGACLFHALVGVDWGHSDAVRRQVLAYLERLAPACGSIRALGSAALALAYVAAGWLDAYFNLTLKPWDVAAGTLIVTEAGGRCSTLEGEAYRVDSPSCLAANNLVHAELLAVMVGATQNPPEGRSKGSLSKEEDDERQPIVSRRKVVPERTRGVMPLIKELREKAKTQRGYVSEETWRHLARPEEHLVVREWESESLAGQRSNKDEECLPHPEGSRVPPGYSFWIDPKIAEQVPPSWARHPKLPHDSDSLDKKLAILQTLRKSLS